MAQGLPVGLDFSTSRILRLASDLCSRFPFRWGDFRGFLVICLRALVECRDLFAGYPLLVFFFLSFFLQKVEARQQNANKGCYVLHGWQSFFVPGIWVGLGWGWMDGLFSVYLLAGFSNL